MTPPDDPLDGCWKACERHPFYGQSCPDCIRASMLAYGRKVAEEFDYYADCKGYCPTGNGPFGPCECGLGDLRRKYGLGE